MPVNQGSKRYIEGLKDELDSLVSSVVNMTAGGNQTLRRSINAYVRLNTESSNGYMERLTKGPLEKNLKINLGEQMTEQVKMSSTVRDEKREPVIMSSTVRNGKREPVKNSNTVRNGKKGPVKNSNTVRNGKREPVKNSNTVRNGKKGPVKNSNTVRNGKKGPVKWRSSVKMQKINYQNKQTKNLKKQNNDLSKQSIYQKPMSLNEKENINHQKAKAYEGKEQTLSSTKVSGNYIYYPKSRQSNLNYKQPKNILHINQMITRQIDTTPKSLATTPKSLPSNSKPSFFANIQKIPIKVKGSRVLSQLLLQNDLFKSDTSTVFTNNGNIYFIPFQETSVVGLKQVSNSNVQPSVKIADFSEQFP